MTTAGRFAAAAGLIAFWSSNGADDLGVIMKRKEHTKTTTTKGAGVTERLARAAATHPIRTIAVFLLLVTAAVLGAGTLLGSGITSEMKFRGGEPASITGQRLVEDRLTGPRKMTDFVIVESATMTVDDPAYRAYVTGLATDINALGPNVVEGAATYYQTKDPTLVSKDKHSTLIPVVMAGDQDKAMENAAPLHELVVDSGAAGFTLAQTGDASLNAMANELAKSDLERAEIFGMPVALIVLLLVFGAVLAAFMPLVLSIISILLAVALTGLIGQVYPMNTFVLNILTMMGLAVGIDYTLFIISRYREERGRGLDKIDAIAATGATANRAIFFSGMTVVLAMLGMVIVPMDITISMGLGVMLVVFTYAAHLSDPAAGDPRPARRQGERAAPPARGPLRHPARKRPRGRLGEALPQHHAAAGHLARGRRHHPAAGRLPGVAHEHRQQRRQRGQLPRRPLRQAGLGRAGPRLLPRQDQSRADRHRRRRPNPRPSRPASSGSRRRSRPTTGSAPCRPSPTRPATSPLLSTPLAGDPASDATQDGRPRPARHHVPAAFGGVAGHVYVTGNTAGVIDYLGFFDTGCRSSSPSSWASASFLLMLAFRSVVVPAQGHPHEPALRRRRLRPARAGLPEGRRRRRLFGLQHRSTTIEAWVPLFLFCILFGLSMDYHVFLLSRIKEHFDRTGDTAESVAHGVGRNRPAHHHRAAALIMVVVFAGIRRGRSW